MQKSIKIKTLLDDDIRIFIGKFAYLKDVFDKLKVHINESYDIGELRRYRMQYQDFENDLITITNELDLLNAIEEAQDKGNVVKIFVKIINDIEVKMDNADCIESFQNMTIIPREIIHATMNMNWKKPSYIQAKALPLLINERMNLIVQSHSGSGKTGTFTIAILSIMNIDVKKLQGLILCHSRELARQTAGVTRNLGKYYSGLKQSTVISCSSVSPWSGQICVCTPKTILSMFTKTSNLNSLLSEFKVLIIDEADKFLTNEGLHEQMLDIHDQVSKHGPKKFQISLFSATYSNKAIQLATKMIPNAKIVELKNSKYGLVSMKIFNINCEKSENKKFNVLCNLLLLDNVRQIIVFVETNKKAKKLVNNLLNQGFSCYSLHKSIKPCIRDNILQKFRTGSIKCLIATNIISRGIVIPSIDLVVNYESSENTFDTTVFIHRVGRCTFGKGGIPVNLVDNAKDADFIKHTLHTNCGATCTDLWINWNDIKKSLTLIA